MISFISCRRTYPTWDDYRVFQVTVAYDYLLFQSVELFFLFLFCIQQQNYNVYIKLLKWFLSIFKKSYPHLNFYKKSTYIKSDYFSIIYIIMESYIDKSRKERVFLKEIFKKIFNYNKYDISYYMTSEEDYDNYDGGSCLFYKGTGTVYKRAIFEIKIRDVHYDDLLLENKKYKSLMKKAESLDCSVYYISVTPNGTYIWKISKDDIYLWNKEEHNKSTTEIEKGTIMKKITYLPITNAKYLDIKTSDYNKLIKEDIKIEMNNHKQNKCLFEWLLKKD